MGQSVTSAVLVEHPAPPTTDDQLTRIAGAFLAGFSSSETRKCYSAGLRQWFTWCRAHDVDPLGVRRPHVELWLRHLEDTGRSNNTRGIRFATLQSFYRWCVDEDLLTATPCLRVRPPRQDRPVMPALTESELHRFLEASAAVGGDRHAVLTVMLLCALRVSEACNANVADLTVEGWIPRLHVTRKGDKQADVVVPPQAMAAIDQALDGRTSGPLFRNQAGRRMTRPNVADAIAKVCDDAGIAKHISPHGLRRTAIQVALKRGVPLRDVQDWVGHVNPSTTAGYDRRARSAEQSPGFTVMAAAA